MVKYRPVVRRLFGDEHQLATGRVDLVDDWGFLGPPSAPTFLIYETIVRWNPGWCL